MLAPREPRTMAVVPSWIEQHCVIPSGFRIGDPFRLYDAQLLYLANFYLVRGDAVWAPDAPLLAAAFVHARGILIGPQKWGKNPLGAAQICAEAEGPVLFAGWAGRDDGYACSDHGCGCGWEYAYERGEPMGMSWPTPLIQVVAFSEDQTDNTWKVLRPMIQRGPLANLIPNVGQNLIRLRGPEDEALIEVVTSSALSRLGQPTTFILGDQLESWWPSNGMASVADTLFRNLGGIGGRATLLANAWDPTQHSVAQREFESGEPDVYRQAAFSPTEHPCGSDTHDHFGDPLERRRIFEAVYPEDHRRENGGHVPLESIDAEARKIHAYDPAQARRYYGNEIVEGKGKAFDMAAFIARRKPDHYEVKPGAAIAIGVDGSRLWDHFPIVATELATGYQWPLHIWTPAGPGREVSMADVDEVLIAAFGTWRVVRLYADPPFIESWVATWIGRWGKDVVAEWYTARPKPMGFALRAWRAAQASGEMSHCAGGDRWCELFTAHVGNAIRRDTGFRDDEGGFLWTVEKEKPELKIDSVPAATLSWEARNDAIAAGALAETAEASAYSSYHSLTGEDLDEGEELDLLEIDPSDPDQHGPFVDELADVPDEEMVPA